ncbi:nuclear transport factor 2 family protein [Segatella paludivivens]|uniref:nuclear transport factor 2 family protein n=1 Tax=Segatella paludivivens TaxID=185294 RepID=UPI000362A436|nr:nuclear transport factor 2 family protein [Segatella paludivivens]
MATLEDKFAIRELQERYATESDKNNQDYYRKLFVKNVKLRVYFYGELGIQADTVDSMITQYKAFGAAKASFHQNGQHVIDFQDDTNATGICYALATLVNEKEGKNELMLHTVRYYDKYEKIDGRWWITERSQYFVYTTSACVLNTEDSTK